MFTTDIETYLHDIAQYAVPTEEQTHQWLMQGDVYRVIESNLRLVVTIAKRWEGRGIELNDAIQEGTLGLIGAVQSYDPTRGRLSKHLGWHIERAIRDALNRRYEVMKLPFWRVERVARLRHRWTEQNPEQELSSASLAQLAACLGVAEDAARDVFEDLLEIERVTHVQSLMTPLSESDQNQEITLADVLEADAASQPDQVVLQEAERHGVWEWLTLLFPMERFIIVKRFGLEDDEEPWTQEAVARHLHMGTERMRSMEARAMMKLRRAASLSRDTRAMSIA